MWPESSEQKQPLRTGLTTGTCATACCVAAAHLLLGKQLIQQASVTLPKGQIVELDIEDLHTAKHIAHAATIKDAGDDPDVTHGAKVWVKLSLTPATGMQFKADEGVGTVTRVGLVLAVGEPAINPVPRQMMQDNLHLVSQEYGYQGGFEVSIGIDNGAELALKTMNGRLGIEGGLSVLGTSGIVRPFSCSAWIASIHRGMDVAAANGCQHIAASTGNTSEAYVQQRYQMNPMQLIEMGDFAGAVLKYLKQAKVDKLTVCGGFGKLSKLANGYLDLHSSRSSIDFEQLAKLAQEQGGNATLLSDVRSANTSLQALKACQTKGIDLATRVCQDAYQEARKRIPDEVEVEIIAVNRQGELLSQYPPLGEGRV